MLALAAVLAALPLLFAASVTSAQSFPSKPVRLVVPAAAGGGFDLIARLLGDKVSAAWGRPVIVENRPGAGHVVATSIVAKADPDGHTLLVSGGNHTLNPFTVGNLPYDTLKDFEPVMVLAKTPFVLIVHPSVKVSSLKELVQYAKQQDGKLNFTATQPNGAAHLSGELLKRMAGFDMTFVPYKGSAPALQDVLAGRVPVMFDAPVTSLPHIKRGAMQAIAVTSATREPTLPNVPTIAESGFPKFDVVAWVGLIAPAGTPVAITEKLNQGFAQALSDADVRAKLGSQGWSVTASSRQAMGEFIKSEMDRWGAVVRASNLRTN
jgi:tripartite-type tricarboxylate transporter receptor subunit TctC